MHVYFGVFAYLLYFLVYLLQWFSIFVSNSLYSDYICILFYNQLSCLFYVGFLYKLCNLVSVLLKILTKLLCFLNLHSPYQCYCCLFILFLCFYFIYCISIVMIFLYLLLIVCTLTMHICCLVISFRICPIWDFYINFII